MAITNESVDLIIQNVGGKENISLLTHCITRLRFVLKDESLVNEDKLKEIDLVQGCFFSNGQCQVIIGPGIVDKVFTLVEERTGIKEAKKEELKKVENERLNLFQKALKIFSDVFYPLLPAIVGSGLLLGISNLLTSAGIFGELALIEAYPRIAGMAGMITMIANTTFTYIPVLVAWSATKRFGGNPMLGVLMGLVLVNQELLSGASMFLVISGEVTPEYWNIFGLKIAKIGYQNSVLPTFAASWVLANLEFKLKKVIPNSLQLILVAPITLLVSCFLTFLCIGPVMNQIAFFITNGVEWLFKVSPIFAGFLFGFLWEPLVITGMHHAFIALNIQLIASTGTSYMLSIITLTCVAEAGAVLAMAVLIKSKKERGVAISAATSALLGVTEPSMFGVTIPAKYPFICSIVGAGIAGMLIMVFDIYAISLGPSGPLSFVIIPAQFWGKHYLAMTVAFIIPFVSTFLIGKRMKQKN